MRIAEKQAEIILAGGRIRCSRCQALSRRSQLQCKKPALKGKRVCGFHGGKSTGPKTAAGKQRMVDAKTIHGRETRTIRAQRSSDLEYLRSLEDAGRMLNVIGGTRTPGRKPASYRQLRTEEEAR
jgi:outer membrane receptor for monomeric catechols